MNKLVIFISVFIGILVIGGIIIMLLNNQNDEPSSEVSAINEQNSSSCEDFSNQSQKDTCYFNNAVLEDNLSTCNMIEDSWKKGDCYSLIREN